jgi:glycosyltransferase involved in cell wall biosynthesis
MPYFSIIIPSYNRAHLIAETIKSVQNQLFSDWECLIIDDGSTDNTKEIIELISNGDNRVKYIYQTNKERSAARNNGIKNASGEYICFLDSDDFYLENHLIELKNKIDVSLNKKALFFSNYLYSLNGKIEHLDFPKLNLNVQEYLVYNPIIPARVCIHNSILKEFLFDEDIVIVEDFLLWLKISYKYPFYHVELNTIIYNIHEDNSVNIKNNSAQKRLNGLKVFFKRYPNIKKELPKKYYNFLIGDTCFAIMKYFIYHEHKWKAIKYLLISILYQKKHSHLKHKMLVLVYLLFNKQVKEYAK